MDENEGRRVRDRVLSTDDDLRDMLQFILEGAERRQLWVLFIDDERRLARPILPMDDYPPDPLETVRVEDLGEVAHSHLMMHRIGVLREVTDNAAVVLVWERRGSDWLGAEERAWARAMAEQARDLDIPLRAQFVLHDGGVRQIHPDDYL